MDQSSAEVLTTLDTYAQANGCSDQYTRVDLDAHRTDIEASKKVISQKVLPAMYAMAGLLGCSFVTMLALAMCFPSTAQKYNRQNDH